MFLRFQLADHDSVDRLFVHVFRNILTVCAFFGVQHRTPPLVAKRAPGEVMPRPVTLCNRQFLSNNVSAKTRPSGLVCVVRRSRGGGFDMGQDLGYFCLRGPYSCGVVWCRLVSCGVVSRKFIVGNVVMSLLTCSSSFYMLSCRVGCSCPIRNCRLCSLHMVTTPYFHRIFVGGVLVDLIQNLRSMQET